MSLEGVQILGNKRKTERLARSLDDRLLGLANLDYTDHDGDDAKSFDLR